MIESCICLSECVCGCVGVGCCVPAHMEATKGCQISWSWSDWHLKDAWLLHECWDLHSSPYDYTAHWAILPAPRFIFLDRKRSHDKPELFFLQLLTLIMCTYVCLRGVASVHLCAGTFRSHRLPWSCSSRCLCATWCGYWVPNSDPLQEIQELLIAKPFLIVHLSFNLSTIGRG